MPKADLKTLHALIRGSYSTKWDADTDAACKSTLMQMLADKGEQRTAQAVHTLIKTEKFFSPAALWNLVPPSAESDGVGRDCCEMCACINGFVCVEYGTDRVFSYKERDVMMAGTYRMKACTHPSGKIIPKERYA